MFFLQFLSKSDGSVFDVTSYKLSFGQSVRDVRIDRLLCLNTEVVHIRLRMQMHLADQAQANLRYDLMGSYFTSSESHIVVYSWL